MKGVGKWEVGQRLRFSPKPLFQEGTGVKLLTRAA
jgi:hypothetical protein